MKSLAYFLSACILLLSSLQGIGQTVKSQMTASCCVGVSCNQEKHQKQDKGCDSKACNRMVSCSRCGFIIAKTLFIQNQFASEINMPLSLKVEGIITGYPQIGWHPPKV